LGQSGAGAGGAGRIRWPHPAGAQPRLGSRRFRLITGFLERDEAPAAGVAREVREELGLARRGDADRRLSLRPQARGDHCLSCPGEGEIRLNEELAEFRLIAPEKLKAWDFGTGLAVRDWLARRRVGS
jgi:NAD+ diphosphatase